jgi:predicted phosphodiesterase
MKVNCLIFLLLFIVCCGCDHSDSSPGDNTQGAINKNALCTFMVAGDIRGYAGSSYKYDQYIYFRGACEEANAYNPDFVVMVGDQDPVEESQWTIDQYLDVPAIYTVGNHDAESTAALTYIRNHNQSLNIPEMSNKRLYKDTTCSFDFQNCHFLIVDQYLGANQSKPKPNLNTELLNWIKNDLQNSNQQYKFVAGHVPYVNSPDADTGLKRGNDLRNYSLEQAEKFWEALTQNGVNAYFCGHTHVYNSNKYDNTWQVNPGVALIDTAADTEGNAGGFCVVQVTANSIILNSWRGFGSKYTLEHTLDITE